jgi:hypothetical protein
MFYKIILNKETFKFYFLGTEESCHLPAGFFFSADISEISPKTGFLGDHRYFIIPNEIFRYS